jgi:hypothetical protein
LILPLKDSCLARTLFLNVRTSLELDGRLIDTVPGASPLYPVSAILHFPSEICAFKEFSGSSSLQNIVMSWTEARKGPAIHTS